MRSLRVIAFLSLSLLGCIRKLPPPTEALENAAARVGPDADASTLALGAFHALLMEGDAAKAGNLFDQAITKDPGSPLALAGQGLMGQRSAVPQKSLAAALELIERNSEHPQAPVAARTVLDLAGLSTSLSQVVREKVPNLLKHEQQADTAHLLRSALVSVSLETGDPARQAQVLSEMGVPTVGTLVGPFQRGMGWR